MHYATIAFVCALPFAASLAQDPAPKHELRWKIASGAVIEASLKDLREDQSSMEITFGDQDPQPNEHASENRFELVWRDAVKAAKDGRPSAVKRKYAKVENEITFGEEGHERETPLGDGEIGIDEREEEVILELPEGLELEDPIRKALRIDAELGAFLPSEPVEIGATWALDSKKLHQLLNHGRGLFEPGKASFQVAGGHGAVEVDSKDVPEGLPKPEPETWEGTCKLVAVEALEGRQVARVELKGKFEREAAEDESGLKVQKEGGGIGIMINAGAGARDQELKGEMLFDLAGGYVRSVVLEIEGDSETESEHEAEFGTIKVHQSSSMTRKVELGIAVTAPAK
jgi:hypothetical protein